MRRIVVEVVIGGLVDMSLLRHARRGKGFTKCFPSVGDPGVEFTLPGINRRFDLGRVGSIWLCAVEGNSGRKI